jgi:hypothetical protein
MDSYFEPALPVEITRFIEYAAAVTWLYRPKSCLLFQMGKDVMVEPEVDDEDLPKLFPRGVEKVRMPSGIAYVRTTRDYGHPSECWDGAIM